MLKSAAEQLLQWATFVKEMCSRVTLLIDLYQVNICHK